MECSNCDIPLKIKIGVTRWESRTDYENFTVSKGNLNGKLTENDETSNHPIDLQDIIAKCENEIRNINECTCEEPNDFLRRHDIFKNNNIATVSLKSINCSVCSKEKILIRFLYEDDWSPPSEVKPKLGAIKKTVEDLSPVPKLEKCQKPATPKEDKQCKIPNFQTVISEFHNNDCVLMNHYENGKEVYLRFGDKKSLSHHTTLLNKISIAAEEAPNLTEPLKVNDFCFGLFENNYERFVVDAVKPNGEYRVTVVDTGKKITVSHIDLKAITKEVQEWPRAVKSVPLSNVEGGVPSLKVVNYVAKLIKQQVKLVCKINESGEVELVTWRLKENVNQNINKLMTHIYDNLKERNADVLTLPVFTIENIRVHDLDDLKPTPDSPVDMIVQTVSNICDNLFYVTLADEDQLDKFEKLYNEIIDYCTKETAIYLPRVNELCLASHEGQWYRACVHKIIGDHAIVTMIDFGNTERIHRTDIRKIVSFFVDALPQMANPCRLAGLPSDCPKAVYSRIKQILEADKVISVTSLKPSKSDYYVQVPELIGILKNENLI